MTMINLNSHLNQIVNDEYTEEVSSTQTNEFEVAPYLRKVRVESFAKTPYFLKSPRSLASNQEFESHFDSDIYNDKNRTLKKKHVYKLSQSSDEIARVTNVFFEKKSSFFDPNPALKQKVNDYTNKPLFYK